MAQADPALHFFERLAEFPIAICKKCKHGVWPDQIEGHLHKGHRTPRKEAQTIGDVVRSWSGLAQYPSELDLPSNTIDAIPQLPQYSDGLLCQLEPGRCRHVLRSEATMKNHWRNAHDQWSAGKKRGRPSGTRKRTVQEQVEKGYRRVWCQRLFVQGRGSQYFEVRETARDQDRPAQASDAGEVAWARVGREMAERWAGVEERSTRMIEDGEKDEVNPWLERTGWLPYLVGLERPALLGYIEEPNSDPQKDEEPTEAALWEAMDEVVRIGQHAVIHRVGVFVKMEAIRTEKHQTRYQPLQPYLDEKSLAEHARPWKQMLMFFARTQKNRDTRGPHYQFTHQQQGAWEALIRLAGGVDEDDSSVGGGSQEEVGALDAASDAGGDTQVDALSALQEACLRFCIRLLDQSVSQKEYDSPLICALAVLGVKQDGWKGPEQYPPMLSATIKVARFMVVQQALQMSDGSGAGRSRGCLQHVQEMMDRFMVRGSHTPMQWMLDLRAYGLKIQYNTTAPGHVEWKGYDELLYKQLHFSMSQFRSMTHGLVAESRRLLLEELLHMESRAADQVPRIPWDHLRDDPTNGRPGWNFLQDLRTQLPVQGASWLFDRVGRDAALRGRFLKPGSRAEMHRQGVERYMSRVVEFREKLAVLMHITGGQPARGPEILSVRHSNTTKGGHRNLFIEDGMAVFVTRNHKGYTVSGDVKIIHRYLPREVGELLVWYLWLVLPFQQRLEAMVWEREAISSHLWPMDPNGRTWTSERLRKVLKRESAAGMGQALTLQAYRQIAIGISRKFMRAATAFHTDEDAENPEQDDETAAAATADAQAGHSSHVAGMVYGRAILEQAGAVVDRRQRFRASSMDWHRFLGFPMAAGEASRPTTKRKRAPFEREAEDGRIERWTRLKKLNAAAQLKRLMGSDATLRSVQEEAIGAIAAGESPVVVVMPTGAGKTMVFVLPAWAEPGGTTIVVVPLVALRGDMMRRCRALGISCSVWDRRQPPDAATIVLVTPEAAVSDDFMTFLNRLRATQQLDRIVIDECHMVLSRQCRFRKPMQQLGKLAIAETQMVLLTATLPPSEEAELFRRMCFQHDRVKMLRASTARANIAYRVVLVGGGGGGGGRREEEELAVLDLVRRKLDKYGTGKVVVYCTTVEKTVRFAHALGCGAYHSKATGKEAILEAFVGGAQRVVVATSSLGMGVDIADIRCVVHADRPRSLTEYAQESGRAGRDGLPCEAVAVEQRSWKRSRDTERTEEEQALVEAYVQGDGGEAVCRRVLLDRYLDGRADRAGCEPGEASCDVCSRGEGSPEAGELEGANGPSEAARHAFQRLEQERKGPRGEYVRRRQLDALEMEWLRQQLQRWAGRCAMCRAAGAEADDHDLRRCWRRESQVAKDKVEMIESTIRFEPYSGCFWCGVPQEVCDRWEENGRGGHRRANGRTCQYAGALVAGVIGLVWAYQEQVGWRWQERMAALGLGSDRDVVLHLGRKRAAEEAECSNLVGEFCWITRCVAELDGGEG